MRKTIVILALTAALAMPSAFAADLITIPTNVAAQMPLHAEPVFDWSGFYAGIYGASQHGPAVDAQIGLGAQLGVNAQFDFFLVGAEVAVQGLVGGAGDTSYGQILGRAGLVVSDNIIVYGAGGYGLDLGAPTEDDVLAGGGVELAINQNVSLEAQYLHGFPINGDNAKDQITVGANFHF